MEAGDDSVISLNEKECKVSEAVFRGETYHEVQSKKVGPSQLAPLE